MALQGQTARPGSTNELFDPPVCGRWEPRKRQGTLCRGLTVHLGRGRILFLEEHACPLPPAQASHSRDVRASPGRFVLAERGRHLDTAIACLKPDVIPCEKLGPRDVSPNCHPCNESFLLVQRQPRATPSGSKFRRKRHALPKEPAGPSTQIQGIYPKKHNYDSLLKTHTYP